MLVPLVLLTLWMGIYPSSFSTFFDATATAMANAHALSMAGSSAHLASAASVMAGGTN
jgi:hypothetical protein